MNSQLRDKIVNYLFGCTVVSKTSFEDFVAINSDGITKLDKKLTIDFVYDEIVNSHSAEQDLIIKKLITMSEVYPQRKKYIIEYSIPMYIIIPTLYSTRLNLKDELKKKINKISELKKNIKGQFYENFCSCFLNDMGLTAQKTKASGDKGIDIVASYSINLPSFLANHYLDKSIYLLAQSKFFSTRVDTPTIRKLVGDSLFIRFDQLEYLSIAHNAVHLAVFSHNGFTKKARDFAKNNKIILFDTDDILDYVCNNSKPSIMESIKFVEQFYKENININKIL